MISTKQKLKLKNEYVGWSFEPALKNIKAIYLTGVSSSLRFKIINVKDTYDDGHSTLDANCEDALIQLVLIDNVTVKVKLTELIKEHEFYVELKPKPQQKIRPNFDLCATIKGYRYGK